MKRILLITILNNILYAGMFGETEEEQKNAKERLRLAMSLKQNPKIMEIRKENNYIRKILKEHKINYKSVIDSKKRGKKIKDIKNYFLVSEEEEINALVQINKELTRILNVNYIEYKLPKRNKENNNEREKAKNNLLNQMKN